MFRHFLTAEAHHEQLTISMSRAGDAANAPEDRPRIAADGPRVHALTQRRQENALRPRGLALEFLNFTVLTPRHQGTKAHRFLRGLVSLCENALRPGVMALEFLPCGGLLF